MISPLQYGAVALARLPIELEHVRDLEEFDGPLLSEFRSADGESYLYHWCDCSATVNRWLVIRTPPQMILRYVVGQSSLRETVLNCRDRFVYMVDMDSNADARSVWFIYVDQLPPNYVPGAKSYHRRDTATITGFQEIYINQKWDYEEVSTYPRKYLQAYAFHTAFGPGGNPNTLSVDYHLTQGWIFHTLFEKMRTNAPPGKRGSLDAVGFASPGYMRFSVDPKIAAGLRDAVARYLEQEASVCDLRNTLAGWANGHVDLTDHTARETLRDLCAKLGVDDVALVTHTNTVYAAAKVISSYIGRLAFLADNDRSQAAMLVGLTPDQGT